MASVQHLNQNTFQDEFIPLDTRRNDGLNHTSLSILGMKKAHKTQTQKTFQQFNKKQQQFHNRASQLSHNSFQGHNSNGIINAPSSQFYQELAPPHGKYHSQNSSLLSLTQSHPHSQHQHQQASYYQPPPSQMIPQGHWSSTPELIESQRYSNTSSNVDNLYDKFSNFTNSPTMSQDEWNNVIDRLKFLEIENKSLVGELEKFQEFKDLNQVLIDENELLREELRDQVKENETNLETNLKTDSSDLNQQVEEITEELTQTQKLNENLQLQIESMNQEIAKLKILNKTSQDKKDREISNLKEEITHLEKELDTHLQSMAQSSINSASTTPSSSSNELFEENKAKLVINTAINTPKLNSTPILLSTPTLSSNSQQQSHTKELVNDLLITIRHLKSDNSMLNSEKSLLYENVIKQKKFIKRLVEGKNQRVKIRKGFNIVEGVDVLI